jgi:DNA polymerase III subunit epsilon
MYAILDIETTGGNTGNERITEIAVFIHDGQKVVDEFQTLLHPEKNIPPFISQMTGITDAMVQKAPKFYEIAKQLIEITEGKVIVAHNSAFDYNFIKREYKNLGYDFKRKTLCTVKLSRKLLPGKKSYSLGKLCAELGIEINGRHRAGGDALATVKLFEILLKTGAHELAVPGKKNEEAIDNLKLNLDKSWLKKLPEETGVYYFFNEAKEVIYIGKSKNIKQRVFQHLTNENSKKAIEMKNNIADIDFKITGSELVALLMESEEIKKVKPLYNRAQRRIGYNYGIFVSYNELGYISITPQKTSNSSLPLATFSSAIEAKNVLYKLVEKFGLCQKLCGLYETNEACFHYSIKKCKGACINKETADEYNKRANQALTSFKQEHQNFLVIDEGKTNNEKSLVLVENGRYKGFGYADLECAGNDLEVLKENIKPCMDNRDVQQIIKTYLRKNKVEKLIKF